MFSSILTLSTLFLAPVVVPVGAPIGAEVLSTSLNSIGGASLGLAMQASPPATPGDGLSQADLEELVAPIALYPDPLLANVLAASVYPDELQAAGAFMAGGGTPSGLANQPWEASVKAIAEVPDALKMMNDYPAWTLAIGKAFVTQGQALMSAVQTMRTRAWDNGALRSTPEQVVAQQGQTIVIQPANPQVIYVPQYNPQVVYTTTVVQSNSGDVAAAGIIGFGVGVAVGAILANNVDCNWNSGHVCWGGGHYHGGNNNVNININNNNNVNINNNNNNINNIGNNNGRPRPGNEGQAWSPNASKPRPTAWSNPSTTNQWKGVGEGKQSAAGKIPGRTDNTPIARPSNRPANSPGNGGGAGSGNRPTQKPTMPQRPSSQPSAPSARPAGPATKNPGGFDLNSGDKAAGQRGSQSRAAAKPSASPSRPKSRPNAPAMKAAPKPAPRAAPASRPSGGGSRGGGGGGGRGR